MGEQMWHREDLFKATLLGNVTRIFDMQREGYANWDEMDENGDTVLHVAAKKGYKTICKSIIKVGGIMNQKNKDGETPLDIAIRRGDVGITKLLIENGYEIDHCKRVTGTPLTRAICFKQHAIIKTLIELGANLEQSIDEYGTVALTQAIEVGDLEIINILLENGADINKEDQHGQTPLYWALQKITKASKTKERQNAEELMEKIKNVKWCINSEVEELLIHEHAYPLVEMVLEKEISLKIPTTWTFSSVMQGGKKYPKLMKHMCAMGCSISPHKMPTNHFSFKTPTSPEFLYMNLLK